VFGALFVELVKSAEESGKLPEILDYYSVYLERSARLARKIKGIMAYPSFIAIFFLFICTVMTSLLFQNFKAYFWI